MAAEAMSYALTILDRPGYKHFIVTGTNSRETVAQYLEEIARKCAARGVTRILIEERLEGPRLATTDVFFVASSRAPSAALLFKAIAYVDVNAAGGLMKFAEDVAANRSVPVKVFASVAEAEAWLEAGK